MFEVFYFELNVSTSAQCEAVRSFVHIYMKKKVNTHIASLSKCGIS